MPYRPQLLVVGGAIAAVVATAILLGIAEDPPPSGVSPVVVCIDSTKSTESVRADYLPDIEVAARRAALGRTTFYAAACGANATGSVNWPVRRRFVNNYGGVLGVERANRQAEDVIKGTERRDAVGVVDLIDLPPQRNGTPLGEMLAVTARQCSQVGGECVVYVFTDGEWADGELKVSDGVSELERESYLEAYVPQLTGLAGTRVNFVGVGYGTSMGELRLGEARDIAAELVDAAGGEFGIWATRL